MKPTIATLVVLLLATTTIASGQSDPPALETPAPDPDPTPPGPDTTQTNGPEAGTGGGGTSRERAKDFSWVKPITEQVRGGSLIQYGFTAGAALVGHVTTKDRKFATSVMPYAAVLPGRWGIRGDATRAYCADAWIGKDAQKAGDEVAKKRALDQVEARQTVREKAHHLPGYPGSAEDYAGTPREFLETRERSLGEEDQRQQNEYPGTIYDETGWILDRPGRCGLAWVPGLYVGIPSKFSVNTRP